MIEHALHSGGCVMSLNRREMLRFGALGAAGLVLSSSASSQILPSTFSLSNTAGDDPLAPLPTVPQAPAAAPAGINPQLLARAKAALNTHRIGPRDTMGVVDFSLPSSE